MNNLPDSHVAVQIEALRALQSEIPLNDFGLPTGIYRTDLLPFHDYKPHLSGNGHGADLIILDDLGPDDTTEEGRERIRSWYEEEGLPKPKESDGEDASNDEHALTTTHATAPAREYRVAGFPVDALSKAYVPLQYDEGFPAFLNGSPFWGRLDYEPGDAFQAFQRYLQMTLGRAADIENDEDFGEAASGTRSISQLAAILHPDSDLLKMADTYQGYYHLYYWNARAHAYDLFRVAEYRNQQELRAIETQDEHYVEARRLRARLMQYFQDDPNFWDMMTPKVGIDFFKTLTGVERISAGIPAAGPQAADREGGAGKPFELHLKTVAQSNRQDSGATVDEEGNVLDKVLADPKNTEFLQELIIRGGG